VNQETNQLLAHPHGAPRSADLGPLIPFEQLEVADVQEYWILDPEHLAHRFYARKGELLVEFGSGQDLIPAQTVPGFWLKRSWLNPDQLPEVAHCLAQIYGSD
jgi:hypothetical protein